MIGAKSLRLFPDALLCVGEDEAEAYGKLSQNLLVHPASVVGIGLELPGSGAGAALAVCPPDAGAPTLLPPPQPVSVRIAAAAPPRSIRRRPSSSSVNIRTYLKFV